MAGAKAWRPLRLAGEGDLPPLLVAFETRQSDYSVQVTDMAHVWTESMERKAICIRAWGENTSIDPSDTPENMSKFLQTLQSALDETSSGHGEATLVATCQLPGFEPLKWTFHLKKSSSMAVANEFAIPLVETLHSKNRQVDMLLQALKHKDGVIAKLSDKLEATGTGLEHVFTALSGRKKVTREAAHDKIRGLAPFNEQKMNDELQNDADHPDNAIDLVQKVFGDTTTPSATSMALASNGVDNWWRIFKSTSTLPHRSAFTIENPAAAPDTTGPSSPPDTNDVTMGEDDDNDDEFQSQSTPPRLRPKKENESTAASKSSKRHSSSKATKEEYDSSREPKRSGRIGAIRGKKQAPPPSPPKAVSPAPPRSTAAAADDDETASETASDVDETASLPVDDDAAASSPPAAAPSPSPAKAPAKKSGLGRIGGKPKSPPVHDAEPAVDDGPPAAHTPAAGKGDAGSAAPSRRLGVIGKRIGGGTASSGDAIQDDAQRGRTTSRNASAEAREGQEKETSQERADRKREELKRELEKKAAAGPAKKKRRF
ncbi:hypothetical protein LLEC1_01574 [Akanthomyces lecanii]|uniref:Non-homologous end-joining factor 1 n=1 Tax=Cordyceps confragosa TaxID=2714763 RepID=A0A179HZT9_CORDF|nr:hypothetical protein LLEC1_01574 [Akanthomyces lecanii]